jgi:hypothetical protein
MANGFGDLFSVTPRSLSRARRTPPRRASSYFCVLSLPRRSDIAEIGLTLCHGNPIRLVCASLDAIARIGTVIEHDDPTLSVAVEQANRFRLLFLGIDWPIEIRRVLSARARAFARPPAKEAKPHQAGDESGQGRTKEVQAGGETRDGQAGSETKQQMMARLAGPESLGAGSQG